LAARRGAFHSRADVIPCRASARRTPPHPPPRNDDRFDNRSLRACKTVGAPASGRGTGAPNSHPHHGPLRTLERPTGGLVLVVAIDPKVHTHDYTISPERNLIATFIGGLCIRPKSADQKNRRRPTHQLHRTLPHPLPFITANSTSISPKLGMHCAPIPSISGTGTDRERHHLSQPSPPSRWGRDGRCNVECCKDAIGRRKLRRRPLSSASSYFSQAQS
jgi:hypothetical protein